MELQERAYSCGPAALRSALYMMGHKVREATIRKVAGTVTRGKNQGTDEQGLIKAIEHYGHNAEEFQCKNGHTSWVSLLRSLKKGHPVLLCIYNWDHWVAAIGTFGKRIIVFDPEPTWTTAKHKKYTGLQILSEDELCNRWRYYEKSNDKYYHYGIIIKY